MGKERYVLFHPDILRQETSLLRHQNAFILPTGHFYWAKGYIGCNPSHQLESSALWISRAEFGSAFDLQETYRQAYQEIEEECQRMGKCRPKRLYYLRSILVHFYGYVLFARQEDLFSPLGREQCFYDYSLIPDSDSYGKTATPAQLEVLHQLFEINRDDFAHSKDPNTSSERVFQKVLKHQNRNANLCHW